MSTDLPAEANPPRDAVAEPVRADVGLVGLVVVNFASSTLLAINLPLTGAAETQVVVVDNFSGEDERRDVTDLARRRGWTLVADEGNPGFGTAVNAGVVRARELGCDVVVLVNPDLTLTAEAVRRLAAAARADRRAIVAPTVFTDDGRPWSRLGSIDLAGGRLWIDDRFSAQWLSGACLAFTHEVWDKVSGFDDDYGMYWEDVDLSFRIQAHGGRLRVLDDVDAVHAVGGTQGGAAGRKSALYLYYNCRNRLVFAAKHLTTRQRLQWLLATPADVRRVLSRGSATRGEKLRSAFGPALAGSVDGFGWLLGLGRRRSAGPDAVAARLGRGR